VRTIWLLDVADTRDYGLWLALAAAAGIAVSSWIATRDERMPGAPKRPDPEPLAAPRP
jgi:hypothetical protein